MGFPLGRSLSVKDLLSETKGSSENEDSWFESSH